MAILLTKGTKEYVPVTVVDSQDSLSSLTTPLYDVLYDNDTTLYSNAVGIAVGLTMNCMVDISAGGPGGLIPEATRFRLFIKFTVGAETPRLGPIILNVYDDTV